MALAELCYIDNTGFHFPDFPTVLQYYKDAYKAIYGADIYLEADSQDGQWIAIQAQAAYDTMAMGAAVYNSFSPATSQSDALSRDVKINGIARRVPTFSTVDLVLVGQAGATITNGQARDVLEQLWNLPASVVIPLSGTITVTGTAAEPGAVSAAANSITTIATPTRGWQTVNNVLPASEGNPVETDAELRLRQTVSVSLPSLSVLEGTVGAVNALPGVKRVRAYENDTDTTNADGLPPHSISLVVDGGDAQGIGEAIAKKKTPGTATYGTTSVDTFDIYGIQNTINFFRPTPATIKVVVTIQPQLYYASSTEEAIKQSLVDYINALAIGDDVFISKLYTPANFGGVGLGQTFYITTLTAAKNAGPQGTTNLTIAFNEAAAATLADITVNVL